MSSETASKAGVLAGALLAAIAVPACADFSRGEPSAEFDAGSDSGAPDGGGDAAALGFASAVQPLLLGACQRCHATGAEAGDTGLIFTGDAAADYATVARFVDGATPTGSRLLSKASGHGHGGGAVFVAGSSEYQTLLDWIRQGARP
jgi:hypothetical protein